MSETPTLYEWAGEDVAIRRLMDCFYDRVEHDELLSPYFPGGVSETHRAHAFTAGIGPAGSHCISLSEASRDELRESYRGRLGSPQGQFELSARVWLAIGRVPED